MARRTVLGRPPRQLAFDIAVSLLVGLLAVAGSGNQPGGWWSTAIGMAMAVPLLVRRSRPVPAAIVVAVLAAVQAAFRWHPLPYDVAVLIAMYSVVKYADRLRDGVIAGAVVAVGVVVTVPVLYGRWWSNAIFLGLVCGAVWSAALNVRTRRLYVVSLEDRAATLERERDARSRAAVAEERTRIARELHDVVAHGLAVMIVQADGARYMIDRDPGAARRAVQVVAGTGREALQEMRRLVDVLRDGPPAGDGSAPVGGGTATVAPDPMRATEVSGPDVGAIEGDPARRRPVLGDLGALLDRSRAAGLRVRHTVHGQPVELPAGLDLTVYRLVQEALTNALKHAGAGAGVDVVFDHRTPGRLLLRVVDDGRGRIAAEPPLTGGHGLVGMRERVALYGGTVRFGPRLSGGWSVEVDLPAALLSDPPEPNSSPAPAPPPSPSPSI
ncbi:sensor histidine kinase [Plantactinospora sp. GCM10030261]|uniref:sensor histidine kinase n=1 Tax=Plantactinospora sp. GCM10030261 TaxID=3273420 RepID=UPI003621E869